MATKIINLAPKGAITNGQSIGSIDYTVTDVSIWDFKLATVGSRIVLFGKHSSQTSYTPFSKETLANIAESDRGVLNAVLVKYALGMAESTGMSMPSIDTTKQIGVYTDGLGHFAETPYTDASNTDTIKTILQTVADGTSTTTGTGAVTQAKKNGIKSLSHGF
ncbi:hypothetical protein ACFFJX_07980 [Pseudarcicella hirudinis]|uniref:hypothetical protein n=1 Tax=Pseudarcicella hirudinis TaxID=1079859 RepID=UPI0035EFA4FF